MYSTASFAFTSTFSWKFFITGRFVQRLKLLNLAHLYGLAKYMHSTVLLLSPQHFPESSFTALFLISWIGPTPSIFHFQQNYYFLLPSTASLAFTSIFSWKFIHSLVFNFLNWSNLHNLSAWLLFFLLPNTASLAFTSTFSWKFIHSFVFYFLNWSNFREEFHVRSSLDTLCTNPMRLVWKILSVFV